MHLFITRLIQIISHQQKNTKAKVALCILRRQNWNLRWQFSKNVFSKHSVKRSCK